MDQSELCIDDQPAAEPSVSPSTSPVPPPDIMMRTDSPNPSPRVVGWGWPEGPGLPFSLSRRRPRAWPAGGWVGTDYWTYILSPLLPGPLPRPFPSPPPSPPPFPPPPPRARPSPSRAALPESGSTRRDVRVCVRAGHGPVRGASWARNAAQGPRASAGRPGPGSGAHRPGQEISQKLVRN